jgi:hypothetical protein
MPTVAAITGHRAGVEDVVAVAIAAAEGLAARGWDGDDDAAEQRRPSWRRHQQNDKVALHRFLSAWAWLDANLTPFHCRL